MTNPHHYCVIMAGGVGSRFWPLSRQSRPKQFLEISTTGKSFLRLAYDRVSGLIPPENIIVVSQTRYRSRVLSAIPELEERNLLLEPYNRNTAPCIAYSSYTILKRDPDAVVLVLPADQVIRDADLFRSTALDALAYASAHPVMITLGVMPRRPDPNFGYIQIERPGGDGGPVRVKTFTEKPSRELAEVFIESGEFLWNTGIFIWRAAVAAAQLERYAPEITVMWKDWRSMIGSPSESGWLEKIYPDMPRMAIDYAVMEKSDAVMAYPARFTWSDLGNWDSLYEYLAALGTDGNAIRISGKGLLRENSGTLVVSTRKDKLIAVKGLKDFIVLDIDDVLMICPRDEKSLKDLFSELALPEYENYR